MVRILAFWRGFKDIAIFLSFIINFILIVVVLVLFLLIFQIKTYVADHLINGLYKSFAGLDESHIVTTIEVNDPAIPVKLNIPLQQNTVVTLTKDVQISGARTTFTLGDGTSLHGSVSIILPANTQLPVALNLQVPVDSSIPINLHVPIDIAVNQTQLHDPITYLRQVLRPYVRLLDNLPSNWNDAKPFAGNVAAGRVNLNGETDFSQHPWPAFCTDLPTPKPGQPIPTIFPDCITPTAPPPTSNAQPVIGSSVPGQVPATLAPVGSAPGTPTSTPGHIEDIGIVTPTAGH